MVSTPAVVIAAPASGSGKTTLATGLIGALRRAGHTVAPFKVGPDYIDPGYHGLAAGRPGRNLDPVLVGAERVRPLYRHGTRGCDIAVVEGVMGLFDGRIDENQAQSVAEGSTAQIAALLGAPVVLVVDARGHSQSLAALLHGFATYDSEIRLGGVILNRVGSERHEQVLRAACERVGLPVLGALPRMAELAVPSRHLGLIPAIEHGGAARSAVDAMTELVAAHVDLGAIARLAASRVSGPSWDPTAELHALRDDVPGATDSAGGMSESVVWLRDSGSATYSDTDTPDAPGRRDGLPTATRSEVGTRDEVDDVRLAPGRLVSDDGPVIAIAGGAAFTFGYAEHRELLAAAGARVAVFDPLRDDLPTGTAGVVLPGGFPEEHAAELSANEPLLDGLRAAADAGIPVHAECAGLLYLTRSLDGHRMAGVVDAVAEFGPRLTLGYRDAVALTDSFLWTAGQRVRGHEFHRTRLVSAAAADSAWAWRAPDGETVREGAVIRRVHASYLHTHPAGNPATITGFVAAAADYTATRVDV
ncbi:cobyrinate a,c-diamide synthase [Nocardia macrotermitis]|uniref:Hydrogenobyrinate a,c-diamide synthase n=1 Tax=Nocardia macrotermitis TaxID=2585198 RepID=A0A7K0CYV0_9NOCA|nr:cobyrinate a,c-diamide synthase [Nocardia macrotermitis]MQY18608.1 Cobyrinate a,c-diamide synthase [Nocardia macrotermitis]